ncbi:hypothetical protein NQ318_022822 [Aromia moschata]|uniref:Uncharacterized protein n=1 Tax=Aromia moschata TaxID=1265417 RepID=A0AAV8XKW5_9CUCU|nr:hypothetical protein NQ318_022822 [Aromia moschata]
MDSGAVYRERLADFITRLGALKEEHCTAPVHRQQCNPVERRVQEVKKALRAKAFDNPRRWDQHLPEVLFALRTRENAATGTSPSRLLLGRQLARPGGWAVPYQCQPAPEERDERAPVHFQPGDRVMVRERRQAAGNFKRTWVGPYPVVHVEGEGVYVVNRDGTQYPFHVDE